MEGLSVAYVPGSERYELRRDGEVLGYATARARGGVVTMPHVEIKPEFRGQNLANLLVRGALDDIEASGGRVVPLCPFVVAFLRRNPKYRAMVVERS